MRVFPIRKLAICGRIRSGKDTAAKYLEDKYAFAKFAFADDMKRYLHELFPNIPDSPKPRRAYQVFGEGLRNLDLPDASHVWINSCMRKIDGYIWWHSSVDDRGANVVITDLRTKVEYDYLRNNGFTIIRVTAPDDVRIARAIQAGDDFSVHDLAHETEQAIDKFDVDYDVVNDGTIDDLKRKIDEILAEINGVK